MRGIITDMDKTKTMKVYARLPKPLHKRAKLEAVRRETTLDALIVTAIAHLIQNSPKAVS